MNILVLYVGSSTLKFQLIDTDGKAIAESRDRCLARGLATCSSATRRSCAARCR